MTIIKVTTGLEIDHLMELGEHHIEIEVDLYKIMARTIGRVVEKDHSTLTITEMTLGEDITGRCKITEIRSTEVDTEL